MKHIIDFKLHGGRVPYFVADYIGDGVGGKHLGQSHDTVENYLPATVVIVEPAAAVAWLENAGIGDDEAAEIVNRWSN